MTGSIRMAGFLPDLGSLGWSPIWLAAALLAGGGLLLAWPMIARSMKTRRSHTMSRRVPTLDDRIRAVAGASAQREALERLVAEARETIRLGCAQLDARLERLERLAPAPEAPRVNVRSVEPARPPQPTPTHEHDPLISEVYALADAGKTAVEIASHLNEHTGKIELMLALRRV